MSRPKLLLADDSVTIRKVVELTFADEGVDVTTVADAETAMQRFVELRPDIVLVDVGLDGTSGYQICEMIKLDEATRHIPVLLLVGSFEPFDQDEAERVGADGFLTKPFHSIRDLVARVNDLLGGNVEVSPGQGDDPENGLEHLDREGSPSEITPEIADIEELYQSSFAETVEIDEFDTVEDLLDDPALDDEMIETSHPAGEPAEDQSVRPSAETTKGFDWSTDSIVTGIDAPEPESAKFEPKFVFEESSAEPVEGSPSFEDHPAEEPSGVESSQYTEPDVEAEDAQPPAERAEPNIESELEPEPVVDSDVPAALAEETGSPAQLSDDRTNMSPEFITAVAQKVLESLSDRVVREVAREAVPQIAEKLIREALDGNKKD
ncbi:MAG: PleD family two-component system response regulator [Pyrinomonadaceae bacterium]